MRHTARHILFHTYNSHEKLRKAMITLLKTYNFTAARSDEGINLARKMIYNPTKITSEDWALARSIVPIYADKLAELANEERYNL